MGQALEGAHRLCEQRGRGAWKKWLAAYTPFLSKRTADRYRALYRRFACAEDVIEQYELNALHGYSRNDVPKWAFEQAVARAKNGEFISAEDARRVLSRKEDDVQSASFKVADGRVVVYCQQGLLETCLRQALDTLQGK
jgi:hypothetical protein